MGQRVLTFPMQEIWQEPFPAVGASSLQGRWLGRTVRERLAKGCKLPRLVEGQQPQRGSANSATSGRWSLATRASRDRCSLNETRRRESS